MGVLPQGFGITGKVNIETATNVLMEIIFDLPQADVLNEDQVRGWIDRTYKVCKGDLAKMRWHVRRAGAVGGSDIGPLVLALRGEDDWFTPGNHIVMQKLFMMSPTKEEGAAVRGIRGEAVIRDIFLKKIGALQDRDAKDRIGVHQHRQYPWARVNVDDIVGIQGKRYLIDYKVPGHEKLQDVKAGAIDFKYKCQLHHGRMIAQDCGIKIDGMLLVHFNSETFGPLVQTIAFDQDIENQVVEAGEFYWTQGVMRGVIPRERNTSQVLKDNGEAPEELIQAMNEYAALKAADLSINKQITALRENITKELHALGGLAGKNAELGMINMSSSMIPDVNKIVKMLQALDINTDRFREKPKELTATNIDLDKVKKLISANQLDEAAFAKPGKHNVQALTNALQHESASEKIPQIEVFSFRTPTGKSERGLKFAKFKADVGEQINHQVDTWKEQVTSQVSDDLTLTL